MMTNTLTAATKTKADKVQGSQDLVEGESQLVFIAYRLYIIEAPKYLLRDVEIDIGEKL